MLLKLLKLPCSVQSLVDGDFLADPSDLVLIEPLFRHHLGGHLVARITKMCQPDLRRAPSPSTSLRLTGVEPRDCGICNCEFTLR